MYVNFLFRERRKDTAFEFKITVFELIVGKITPLRAFLILKFI
jgi:hypothetical protein